MTRPGPNRYKALASIMVMFPDVVDNIARLDVERPIYCDDGTLLPSCKTWIDHDRTDDL